MSPKDSPTAAAELARLMERIRQLENDINQISRDGTLTAKNKFPHAAPDNALGDIHISEDVVEHDNILNSVLEHIEDGVIVANTKGEMIFFNDAARRLVGIGPVSGSENWALRYGLFYSDGVTPFPSDELPLSRALRGETVRNQKVFVTNADIPQGTLLSASASTLRNSTGMPVGAIVIFHDLTEATSARVELERRDHALVSAQREIKAQQNLFAAVLESIEIGVTVANADGEFVIFNPAARKLLGVGPVTGVENWTPGYGCFRMDGSPYPAEALPLARALRGEHVRDDKLYIRNPETDENVLLSVSASPFVNVPADFEGAFCFFSDVTDATRAQAQIAMSEERFRAFMENLPAIAFIKDFNGRYIYGNHAFYEYHNTSPAELAEGMVTDYSLTQKSSADQIRDNDQKVLNGSAPLHIGEHLVDSEGASTWFAVYKFRLTGLRQEILLGGIAMDVTERRQTAERLKADEKLLRQMIVLQEKERLLVAHDIHDGFVQDVVGAKMLAEALAGKIISESETTAMQSTEFSHQFTAITDALGSAVTEARRLISHLRPLVIDEEGVVEAIRYLISEKRYAEPFKITFIPEVPHGPLDPLLEGNLFRIVQEALNNIERHSEAGKVSISLKFSADEVSLYITDDGCGFNPATVSTERFGIRGMRERARLFGGTLTIISAPGTGTRITARLPLATPAE